ncbi:TetR family transcriptional regulator [Plantactinospora sp. GCM10030261]|uniref:TetR family transcriptional regulator n=1 Tax=Plantactinospora sp. GCM10030261 TaxID=3273420 RepID=UPI00360F8479
MTRQRILAVAAALFAERGYRATSMQEIADRIGITKAALYYHFAAKQDVLHELTGPVLDELEQTLNEAEAAGDAEAVRWRAIEAFLDVFLRHRDTLLMLVRDLTLLAQAPVGDRFRAAIALANTLVSGPRPTLAQRVRAAQVVAGLTDPVVLFRDVEPARLRRLILGGSRALLVAGDPAAADGPPDARTGAEPRTHRRAGGRPAALTAADVTEARRLRESGRLGVDELADRYGVSRATIYRVLKTS